MRYHKRGERCAWDGKRDFIMFFFSFSVSSHYSEKPHRSRLWGRNAHHRVSLQHVCGRPISLLWTPCSRAAFMSRCKHKHNGGGGHRVHFLSRYRGMQGCNGINCELTVCFRKTLPQNALTSQRLFSCACRKCCQSVRAGSRATSPS